MKKLLLILSVITIFSGCKKTIEKKGEDLVIQAMTNGQWAITSFTQNSIDITSDFTGYKFQYYADKTVDAIKNGTVEKKGNWDGDGFARTTWANFANATAPLDLINGSWHIDDSSWTYVIATQTTGGTTKTMRLDKL